MFRMIGLLLLAPFIIAAIVLRIAVFVPIALLFLVPVLIMRPRLILRAPRMFRYMLMAKRGGWRDRGPGHRWQQSDLERAAEPIKL